MATMTRWNPVREMMDLNRVMNQFMGTEYDRDLEDLPLRMTMDVSETKDAYEIVATMPGVKPDEVEITLNNDILTIRGKMEAEEEKEDKNYHMRERRTGFFVRSIALPSTVNANAIEATYENGLLKLRLPKVEAAKPKQIKVKSAKEGGEPKKQTAEEHSKQPQPVRG